MHHYYLQRLVPGDTDVYAGFHHPVDVPVLTENVGDAVDEEGVLAPLLGGGSGAVEEQAVGAQLGDLLSAVAVPVLVALLGVGVEAVRVGRALGSRQACNENLS